MSSRLAYNGVAVAVPVSTVYERYSTHGAVWYLGQALSAMLSRSGLDKKDIDGLAVSSYTLTPDSVLSLTEYFSMTPRWVENLHQGGASGVVALHRAARAVQCGDANIVACISADTSTPESFRKLISNFSMFTIDSSYPYGAAGPNSVFAMITRHYMECYNGNASDFGRICVSQRHNALSYAGGIIKKPLSMDDYLAARIIADPLRLYDCVMPCAGGESFLVMSTKTAESLGLPYARILSIGELYNKYYEDDVHSRGGWASFRKQLYADAGISPSEIDLVQLYDDYPVIVMMQLEDLGFCEKGTAARFIRETPLTFDGGGLPVNTSGGQLSVGQAGAAGGFLGVVEALRQLVNEGLSNQVRGAHTALVSGYGMVNYDRCICTNAAILQTAT